jgi:nitrile hydratase subunit beta
MDGVHDMGGMHGFGRVQPEENEPVFHADWERVVYGISRALRIQGLVNIDESRHAIERMPPADYLASSYYERWLAACERLAIEKGIVTADELERRVALLREQPDAPLPERQDPSLVEVLRRTPSGREAYEREGPAPRFAVGDRVLTRNTHPTGHTRLPRYARGKHGTIHQVWGDYVFPDAHAYGQGEQPQPLYSVRFEADELWGDSADGRGTIYIDLWESYLLPDATVSS